MQGTGRVKKNFRQNLFHFEFVLKIPLTKEALSRNDITKIFIKLISNLSNFLSKTLSIAQRYNSKIQHTRIQILTVTSRPLKFSKKNAYIYR